MYAGPGITPWVCPHVCADAPDNEFMGVRRPLEDIGVITIQAPLHLNYGRAARLELYFVVMPVAFAGGCPFVDETLILHVIKDVLNEVTLLPHRCDKLAANTLNRASEQAAVVKLFFVESVITERMRFRLQRFRKVFNLLVKIFVQLARDDTHAASLALVISSRIGSTISFARNRTTGTTTPSPVR